MCDTAKSGARLPLWVKSRHRRMSASCPLYPQKRTLESAHAVSYLTQSKNARSLDVSHARRPDGRDRGLARPPGHAHDRKTLSSSRAELHRRYHSGVFSKARHYAPQFDLLIEMTTRSSRISSGKQHQKTLASLLVSAILVEKNRATYQDFKCCIRFPPRAPKFVFYSSEFFQKNLATGHRAKIISTLAQHGIPTSGHQGSALIDVAFLWRAEHCEAIAARLA